MLLIALLSPNPFIPLKNQYMYYINVIDINGTDTFTVKKKVSYWILKCFISQNLIFIIDFPVDQLPSRRYPFWGFSDFWSDF